MGRPAAPTALDGVRDRLAREWRDWSRDYARSVAGPDAGEAEVAAFARTLTCSRWAEALVSGERVRLPVSSAPRWLLTALDVRASARGAIVIDASGARYEPET